MKKQLSSSALILFFIMLMTFLIISCKEENNIGGMQPGAVSWLQEDGSWLHIDGALTVNMPRTDTVMIMTFRSFGIREYDIGIKNQRGGMNVTLLDTIPPEVWNERYEGSPNGMAKVFEQRVKITAPPYHGGQPLITFRVVIDNWNGYYSDITVRHM